MHDIQYHYPTANNRLGSITATGINSSTYQYDALGNLVRDNAENLTVAWNSLGKVDSIVKNSATISSFRYSPTGQRQMKAVRGDTTFYIQDATGNVMCVYRLKNDTLTAMERYLYGSKRLGMLEQQVWIKAGGAARLQDTCTIGHRLYELTDHLGNVTTTLFDRKILIFNINEDTVYMPAVNTYTDYYPFGYPMSWRSFDMGGYRYFFNGQEADNEVLGEGALHAFEYRMHDTRIGRFWSVDPLAGKFPWNSTYAFAENSPIGFLELEGLETVRFGSKVVNFTGMSKEQVKATLKEYKDYHHGNLSVDEIMSTANDKEYWDVSDINNVYMRCIGTRIIKHSGSQVSTETRQRWYQWMIHVETRIDGGYDGANQGTRTAKDWVVGLGFISAITGIGEIAAVGDATVGVVVGLVNALDDAFGIFTKGSGSLSQDLTPQQAKVVTNSAKTILSAIKTGYDAKKVTQKSYNKLKGVLETLINLYDTYDRTKTTIKDEQKQTK